MAATERNRRSASLKIPDLLFRGDSQRYPNSQMRNYSKNVTISISIGSYPKVQHFLTFPVIVPVGFLINSIFCTATAFPIVETVV
jgi:hypothetical protein